MREVKIYDWTDLGMEEFDGPERVGLYVRASDYAALEAERDQLRAMLATLRNSFPLLDDNGLDETEHHCEWHIQQQRKRLHAILDGASDATKQVEADEWTHAKPTQAGAYWIRGNLLMEPALVQVKNDRGQLWCNLHMNTTEPDFRHGFCIAQLSDQFEWIGPIGRPGAGGAQ